MSHGLIIFLPFSIELSKFGVYPAFFATAMFFKPFSDMTRSILLATGSLLSATVTFSLSFLFKLLLRIFIFVLIIFVKT
nr:MAG TPA: hypothetical protein [Caudoviricetes sp.]